MTGKAVRWRLIVVAVKETWSDQYPERDWTMKRVNARLTCKIDSTAWMCQVQFEKPCTSVGEGRSIGKSA